MWSLPPSSFSTSHKRHSHPSHVQEIKNLWLKSEETSRFQAESLKSKGLQNVQAEGSHVQSWRNTIQICSSWTHRGLHIKFSFSYSPTSLHTKDRLIQCWLTECTIIWIWLQHSNACNWFCLIAANISRYPWFCSESTSLLLYCYALACGLDIVTTLQAFYAEHPLWHFDWLKLCRWLAGQTPLL